MFSNDKAEWYYSQDSHSTSWMGADSLYRFVTGEKKSEGNGKIVQYPPNPYYDASNSTIIYSTSIERKNYDFQVGNLVFVKYNGSSNFGHVMAVVGLNGSNNPIFAHQSNGEKRVPGITLDQVFDKQALSGVAKITHMTVVRFKDNP